MEELAKTIRSEAEDLYAICDHSESWADSLAQRVVVGRLVQSVRELAGLLETTYKEIYERHTRLPDPETVI